eukprot:TRINITY_DN6122_c0_g1_i3.p1 TRINITY_DN6122_c0_g1~~TRINITY_DN6122_c0_g1_i3.p1  ORF type:complete len:100 (+),score=11.70 TRINITY_DN6122_c0_g1_i3:36-335(+)
MASKGAQLNMLRRKIFNEVLHPPQVRSPTKYLKALPRAERQMKYYPEFLLKDESLRIRLWHQGIMYDERLAWREKKMNMNKARGKFPVKKGEGKKSKKK